VRFGVALVHAKQVCGEERRLVTARARSDLQDHVLLVVRIRRDQKLVDLGLELLALLLEPIDLGSRQRAQLLVRLRRHRLRVGQLLPRAAVALSRIDERPDGAELLGDLRVLLGRGGHGGVGEPLLEFLGAGLDLGNASEQVGHQSLAG
jgi:hypothetical protein